jgi:hypothetical protein
MAVKVGASLTGVTVKIKGVSAELPLPSYARGEMVAVPFQSGAGVSVRVEPVKLTVTFVVDEVAVKVTKES